MRRPAAALALFVLAAACAETADACTVCFGAADDAMTRGMNNGILTLLTVVGIVQVGFVAMFYSFWRRGRKRESQRQKFHLIDGGTR